MNIEKYKNDYLIEYLVFFQFLKKKTQNKQTNMNENHKYRLRVLDLPIKMDKKDTLLDIFKHFRGCGNLDVNIVDSGKSRYADIGFPNADSFNVGMSRDTGKIGGKNINLTTF